MAGRKSLKDELQIIRRYSELTVPYFKVIKDSLESKDKESQQWAVERLDKAFVKMIPQEIDAKVMTISQILDSIDDEESTIEEQGVADSAPIQDKGQEQEAKGIQTESGAGTLQPAQSQPQPDTQE